MWTREFTLEKDVCVCVCVCVCARYGISEEHSNSRRYQCNTIHRFGAIALSQSMLLLDLQAKHAAGDSLDNWKLVLYPSFRHTVLSISVNFPLKLCFQFL